MQIFLANVENFRREEPSPGSRLENGFCILTTECLWPGLPPLDSFSSSPQRGGSGSLEIRVLVVHGSLRM